jgi:hypothetical protein
MQNIATDVIPPAGFIHRPSLLWPPLDPALQQRVDIEMIDKLKAKVPHLFQRFYPNLKIPEEPSTMQSKLPDSAQLSHELSREEESGSADLGDRAEPSDCMRLNIDGEKVEMRDQIHLYALNSQLGNPLVSPALQPSLAGLPPLLIVRPLSLRRFMRDDSSVPSISSRVMAKSSVTKSSTLPTKQPTLTAFRYGRLCSANMATARGWSESRTCHLLRFTYRSTTASVMT